MTYSATYCALISKRLQNPITKKDCYCEKHHIIPASEGGDDSSDNLVNLTAREHYVAHLLLAKIYDDKKMWTAIHRMIHGNKKYYTRITSRIYSKIKAQYSKKLYKTLKGKTFSEEHKRNLSESHKGKMIGENNPFFGKHYSDETRKRITESLKGKFAGEKNPMFGTHLRFYNNGIKNIRAKECPTGFVPGRLKFKTTQVQSN